MGKEIDISNSESRGTCPASETSVLGWFLHGVFMASEKTEKLVLF